MIQDHLFIFDMDGVLHDTERHAWLTANALLKPYGIEMGHVEFDTAYGGVAWTQLKGQFEHDFEISLPEDFVEQAKNSIIALGENQVLAAPGVAQILDFLTSAGAKLCIASNAQRLRINQALALSGLAGYFDEARIFSGYEVDTPKPAPDLHLSCLKALGFSADKALIFEDSVAGAQGGINAKIAVCGYVGLHPNPANQEQRLKAIGVDPVHTDWSDILTALEQGRLPHG